MPTIVPCRPIILLIVLVEVVVILQRQKSVDGVIQVSELSPQAEIDAVATEVCRWKSNGCCAQGIACRNCDCNPEYESHRANNLAIERLHKRQKVKSLSDMGDEHDD
jgi:hypothetical protein